MQYSPNRGQRHGKQNLTEKPFNPASYRKLRIAILMSSYGLSQQIICKSLKKYFKQSHPGEVELFRFCQNTIDSSTLEKQMESIINQAFDLTVTIGVASSHAAKKVTYELDSDMPVVFTMVPHPVKEKLIYMYGHSRNNLTGIAAQTASLIVPAQIAILSTKKKRRILIPHVEDHLEVHNLKEFDQFKENMEQQGKIVTIYEIKKNELLNKKLFPLIHEHDFVMLPESSMLQTTRDAILEYCKPLSHIETIADGKDATEKGAIFGVTSDLRLVGQQAGEMILKICVDGKKPSEVKSGTVRFARRLAYNYKGLRRIGVSFNPDIFYLFDLLMANNEPLSAEDFAKLYGLITFTTNAADRKIVGYLIEKISAPIIEQGGTPPPRELYKELVSTESRNLKQEINDILSDDDIHQIHAGGTHVLANLFSQMDKRPIKKRKAIFSMQYALSINDAIGIGKARPDTSMHHATVIEPVCPGKIFQSLKRNSIRIDKVITLVENLDHIHDVFLSDYRQKAATESELCKVTSRITAPLSVDEMKTLVKNNATGGRTPFVISHHFMAKESMYEMARYCHEHKVLCFVVGEDMGNIAPLGAYLDGSVLQHMKFDEHHENVKLRIVDDERYTFYRDKRLVKMCTGQRIRDHRFDVPFEEKS